jgi:hypothetical protein
MVAAAIEARAFGPDVALGFAVDDSDAVVMRLNAETLAAAATVEMKSGDPVRRVTPILSPNETLGSQVDVDRAGDGLHARRTAFVDPIVQIGTTKGALAWTSHPGEPADGELWSVGGDVEPVRAAAGKLGSESIVAVVFRREASVGVGFALWSTGLAPKAPLTFFSGGSSVGTPTVAMSGGATLIAWAERANPDAPWGLRIVKCDGTTAGQPRDFLLPGGGKGGQAISPALVSLPDKGFLLTWSEGPAAGRTVRAVTLDDKGDPIGAAFDVSAVEGNAGQPQAAIAPTGHGVVTFFQSVDSGFELVAAPITCGS